MSELPTMLEAGRRLALRAVYEVKTIVAGHPSLALPAARLRGREALVHPGTDIMIEGFPRSANSFSVAAFMLAQGRPTDVAHHTHASGHVLAALRMGVPTMVLIREPEESVLGFAIVRPSLTLRQVLRGWMRFYAVLLPHLGAFVVAPFPQVTADFGLVIRRVNTRFGTNFKEFEHTEENVRECFRQTDVYWQDRLGPDGPVELYVGRPSKERELRKKAMLAAYRAGVPAALRVRAEALYRIYAQEGRA